MKHNNGSLLGWLLSLFGIFFFLLLLLSYLSGFVSPVKSLPVALCGILYPYLLVLCFCFLIYWFLHRKRIKWLALVVFVAGVPFIFRCYQYAGVDDAEDSQGQRLKIMTYNVQLCGAYRDNRPAVQESYRNTIFGVIDETRPDVLCMQEFYQSSAPLYHTTDLLDRMLPGYYCYPDIHGVSANYIGNLIYSRYPIVRAGCIGQSSDLDNHSVSYADVVVGMDTVRIYNLHLKSVQFQQQDYDFAQQLTDANFVGREPITAGSRRILKKLKVAYAARTQQVDSIVRHMDHAPYPLIVCGDFNDIPWSYTYQQFKKRLSDSYMQSGLGRGNTFSLNKALRFRIDYIFCDKQWKCSQHTVIHQQGGSDHYPVVTYVLNR